MAEKAADVTAGWTKLGWEDDVTSYFSVAGNVLIKDKWGVSAGVCYGLEREYAAYNTSGLSTGSFRPRNLEVRAGASYRIFDFLSLGASFGYLSQKLSSEMSYRAFSANVSAMVCFDFGSRSLFKAMLEAGSLGTSVKSADGTGFHLPSFLRAEAGYGLLLGKHRVEALGGCSYHFFSHALSASAGVSYSFNSLLFFRGGYNFGGDSLGGNSPIPSYASAGVGVKFFGVSLDAAYLFGSEVIRNSLALTLGYSF